MDELQSNKRGRVRRLDSALIVKCAQCGASFFSWAKSADVAIAYHLRFNNGSCVPGQLKKSVDLSDFMDDVPPFDFADVDCGNDEPENKKLFIRIDGIGSETFSDDMDDNESNEIVEDKHASIDALAVNMQRATRSMGLLFPETAGPKQVVCFCFTFFY